MAASAAALSLQLVVCFFSAVTGLIQPFFAHARAKLRHLLLTRAGWLAYFSGRLGISVWLAFV